MGHDAWNRLDSVMQSSSTPGHVQYLKSFHTTLKQRQPDQGQKIKDE